MDQGTESYLIASEMKERLDKGKKVTKSQKANLKESLFWDGPEITLGEIYDFGDVQETKKTSGVEVKMSRDLSKKIDRVAKSFGISDVNDGINVHRSVFNTLLKEGFFENDGNSRIIKNKNTDAIIEINKSGIQETFGKAENFANIGKQLKYFKLATVRNLPTLLESAVLVESDVKNKHKQKSSVLFDYYKVETDVDGIPIVITFDIKKSPQKNKFWVHKVDVKENAEANASGADALKRRPNLDVNNSISNNISNVNTSSQKSSKDLSGEEVIRSDDEIPYCYSTCSWLSH